MRIEKSKGGLPALFLCLCVCFGAARGGYGGNAYGASIEELWQREASIESTRIQGRRAYLEIDNSQAQAIEKGLNGLNATGPDQAEQQVTALLSGLNIGELVWCQEQTVSQGDRYKHLAFGSDNALDLVQTRDADAVWTYSPKTKQRQVDIYPVDQGGYAFRLQDLNITLGHLRQYPVKVQDADDGGLLLDFSVANQYHTRVRVDGGLATRHVELQNAAGSTRLQFWHVGVSPADGYLAPKVVVTLWPQGDHAAVEVCAIDAIQFNCPVSEEDLAKAMVCPWAVVVDHRTQPPTISQAMERPDSVAPVDESLVHQLTSVENILDHNQLKNPQSRPSSSGADHASAGTSTEPARQSPGSNNGLGRLRWATLASCLVVCGVAGGVLYGGVRWFTRNRSSGHHS